MRQFILEDRNDPDTDRSRLFVVVAGEPLILRENRLLGTTVEICRDEAANFVQPVFITSFVAFETNDGLASLFGFPNLSNHVTAVDVPM